MCVVSHFLVWHVQLTHDEHKHVHTWNYKTLIIYTLWESNLYGREMALNTLTKCHYMELKFYLKYSQTNTKRIKVRDKRKQMFSPETPILNFKMPYTTIHLRLLH